MIDIQAVPVFNDNYVWILSRSGCDRAVVVDPGDGGPVVAALQRRGLAAGWILITHHHHDHVGGVAEVAAGGAEVIGPAGISGVTRPVDGGDRIRLDELDLELEVVHTPGHTLDHVAYLGPGFALVGDTLFAGGCGRLFEGTPEQMLASLDRLAGLDQSTRIYCAHEYTVANLRFAQRVEPDNTALTERLEQAFADRGADRPTVPSTLALELATNPFLRSREPAVVAAATATGGRRCAPGVETFAAVRAWKDRS